jgi:hypothetical protein
MPKSIFKKTHIFPDDIVINILSFIKQFGPMILLYDFKQKKFINTEHPHYTSDKLRVQNNGMWLGYVERQLQTEEMCRFAVLQNGMALKYMIKQTDEIAKLAVQQNADALKHVQKKTEEICKLAILSNVKAIKYIPYKKLSTELCKLAVLSNVEAIKYFPSEFQTQEICNIVAQTNRVQLIELIDKKYQNSEMYVDAIKRDGYALLFVRKDLQTEELCKLAVQQNGYVLQYVRDDLQTEEICKLAVQQDRDALRLVKDNLLREELRKLEYKRSEFLILEEKLNGMQLNTPNLDKKYMFGWFIREYNGVNQTFSS